MALAHFLDGRRIRTSLHGASDDDSDLPIPLAPFKPGLRRLLRRGGMPWYKLSDLAAEAKAFGACLTGRADIVHLLDGEHSGRFLPVLLRRARLSSTRVIATFHQPPGIVGDLVDPELVSRLDQVVLVSPSQRGFFSRFVEPERLHTILHGIDTEFFRPREPESHGAGRFRCVTVGYWLRDWRVFREVAGALPDIEFDVVTGRALGLEALRNVRMHQGLGDEELAELYRSADVLFLPLLDSTANNALLEGIASGLPVLTTCLEATQAYLPNGEGILVPPGSVPAAIEALSRLRDDPALRLHMARAARARAEVLAWPRIAPSYEAVYVSALQRPPAPYRTARPRAHS